MNKNFIYAAVFAATYRCPENNNDGFKVVITVGSDEEKLMVEKAILERVTGISPEFLKPTFFAFMERLFDYEDKEMLQKNIRIMRSDEFEDVIKTDADMPDYMFYYLPELGNTILPSSHRGFKYRPVIMNVYNEKDVDVDEYNDMFKLDKEKKNLETQEKVFESIKNDFKKN